MIGNFESFMRSLYQWESLKNIYFRF